MAFSRCWGSDAISETPFRAIQFDDAVFFFAPVANGNAGAWVVPGRTDANALRLAGVLLARPEALDRCR